MYGIEGSNLTIYRTNYNNPTGNERLTDIDLLMSSQRLGNTLKLFNTDERKNVSIAKFHTLSMLAATRASCVRWLDINLWIYSL